MLSSIISSGFFSSTTPRASATAMPSRAMAPNRPRRVSAATPWGSPVRAATPLDAQLKISLVHMGPRGSATERVSMPARVRASASRSDSARVAGLPAKGPIVVAPFVS